MIALPPLTPARSADVSHLLDRVHHCDALRLLAALPDASVQLIAVDPPYNGVKDKDIAPWDNQWRDDDEFIAWMGALCREWRRALTPNGSLYVFASPRLAARVEVEIGRWFNVLNQVVWRKEQARHKGASVDDVRGYFPQTERIIFAEQFGAESYAIGDIGEHYFQPIQEALEAARNGRSLAELSSISGLPESQISHYFCRAASGWRLPNQYALDAMQLNFNEQHLNQWREDLRREYEDLRRPFNSHPFAPYTDVWDFPTVGAYEGKHPAEKPLAMMEHIVKISSRPGDIVLDCFCGSGTTLDAARRNDRHYIGGDFTAHWADYSRRRVSLPYNVRLPFEEAV